MIRSRRCVQLVKTDCCTKVRLELKMYLPCTLMLVFMANVSYCYRKHDYCWAHGLLLKASKMGVLHLSENRDIPDAQENCHKATIWFDAIHFKHREYNVSRIRESDKSEICFTEYTAMHVGHTYHGPTDDDEIFLSDYSSLRLSGVIFAVSSLTMMRGSIIDIQVPWKEVRGPVAFTDHTGDKTLSLSKGDVYFRELFLGEKGVLTVTGSVNLNNGWNWASSMVILERHAILHIEGDQEDGPNESVAQLTIEITRLHLKEYVMLKLRGTGIIKVWDELTVNESCSIEVGNEYEDEIVIHNGVTLRAVSDDPNDHCEITYLPPPISLKPNRHVIGFTEDGEQTHHSVGHRFRTVVSTAGAMVVYCMICLLVFSSVLYRRKKMSRSTSRVQFSNDLGRNNPAYIEQVGRI